MVAKQHANSQYVRPTRNNHIHQQSKTYVHVILFGGYMRFNYFQDPANRYHEGSSLHHRLSRRAIAALFLAAFMPIGAALATGTGGSRTLTPSLADPSLPQADARPTQPLEARTLSPGSTSSASQSSTVDLHISASNNTAESSTASLTVNGEDVPIPENSSSSTTVRSNGTITNVSISSNNISTGNTDSKQKIRINSRSSSDTSISLQQDEMIRKAD